MVLAPNPCMANPDIETLMLEGERLAIARAIRRHPEWTLEQLLGSFDGPRGPVLSTLTLHEIVQAPRLEAAGDGGPPIDLTRLERAKRLSGPAFAACVREVLDESYWPVGAAYLRSRVGGPRWKLQSAMRQLEAQGVVERSGVTSATEYQLTARCRGCGRRRTQPS